MPEVESDELFFVHVILAFQPDEADFIRSEASASSPQQEFVELVILGR